MTKSFFTLLLISGLLTACATDSKDMYFRSRLPTGENPHFNAQGKFGANLELESERTTMKLTKNLVTDFRFQPKPEDRIFAQKYGEIGLVGLDFALTYVLPMPFPIELAASYDYAEMKIGLLGFMGDRKSNVFLMLNGGYYKTAAYVSDGSCKGRICWPGAPANSSVSDTIDTELSGNEKKIGGALGYFNSNSTAFYFSYNWMDYHYVARATQTTTPFKTINFSDSMYGMGTGLGVMLNSPTGVSVSFSVDNVRILGFQENYDQIVYGLKLNL